MAVISWIFKPEHSQLPQRAHSYFKGHNLILIQYTVNLKQICILIFYLWYSTTVKSENGNLNLHKLGENFDGGSFYVTWNCYYKVMHDCVPAFKYFSMNFYALGLRQLSWRYYTYCCTKKTKNSRCPCWMFWFPSVHTRTDLMNVREFPASMSHFEKLHHIASFLDLFLCHLCTVPSLLLHPSPQ